MSSSPHSQQPASAARQRASRAELDASCRWPVGLLLVIGVAWLVVGGLLAVLAAIKLHAPGMFANCAWLTYGRLQPAAWNALVFGFGVPVGLGVAAWLITRLGGAPLPGGGAIIVASLFWSFGVKIGIFGILAGDGTGVEFLEFPRYAPPVLLLSYIGVAGWILIAFRQRREPELYISQWYLLGALFAFPWVYAAAQIFGVFFPLRGVLQAAVQAWFVQGLLVFWFGFIGLAVLYYLGPKTTGRGVGSRNLAIFGFWGLAALGGFGGLTRYFGGPFPAYMSALAVVASVLSVFPIAAIAMSLAPTLRAKAATPGDAPVLRYAQLAFLAFVVAGGVAAVNALASVRRTTGFTLVTLGVDQLTLWGFYGAATLAAVYFLVPRITGRAWPSSVLLQAHFALLLAAVVLITLAFLSGGVLQGRAINDPSLPFFLVVKRYLPFASTGTLAQLLLWLGNLCLAVNLARLLLVAAGHAWLPGLKALVRPDGAPTEVKA